MKDTLLTLIVSMFIAFPLLAENKIVAPSKGKIFFLSPKEGETVASSFRVQLATEGMKVTAAGKNETNSGHHVIIIKGGWISSGSVIQKDGEHIHLDGGETETTLKLAPGEYTLTAQFADTDHKSFGQPLSQTIHIKVK